jgi:hypothetical protein
MASNPQPGAPAPAGPSALDSLLARRTEFTVAMFVPGILLAVVPSYLLLRRSFEAAFTPVFVWATLVAVVCLGTGVANLLTAPEPAPEQTARRRMLLLVAGGLSGLLTAVLIGGALPLTMAYREHLAGGLESWRAHPFVLIWPGLGLFGGLALMFASLQLARGLERTSAGMRRLVYGYNAVLSSLLLLAVLALANVLAYAAPFSRYTGRTYDWTREQVHTLSPQTRNLLAELKEPLKVYVLLPRRSVLAQDMETILENARSLTDKLSWELVDPRVLDNQAKVVGLMQKYKLSNPAGVLLVYGTDPKTEHDFIPDRDLGFDRPRRPDEQPTYTFTGESALLNSLKYLTEGKVVAYFTQGSGEMELNSPERETSLSELKNKLTQQKNFEVKELRFDRKTRKVPADADVVVIARPTQRLPEPALAALREYLRGRGDRKGKLIVLLDPVVREQGGSRSLVQTGLEGLLAGYNVRVGDNHVLTLEGKNPRKVQALTNPRSTNPVARAFFLRRTVLTFTDARTVTPSGKGPAAGGYTAEEQVLVPSVGQAVWVEKDMNRDPEALASRLRADPALAEKVLSEPDDPPCVAVAVSESAGAGMPRDPAHAGLFRDRPRIVVFGNAGWVSDRSLQEAEGQARFDLFSSYLSWLREKAAIGAGASDENKERKAYNLNVPERSMSRLEWLPLALMTLGVVGLGLGVWVVRRR